MIALPIVWGIIAGTAVLSAVVTQALPYVPKYWSAFIGAIKRVFTKRATTPKLNVYCDDLSKRIDDLQEQINELREQMDNVAKNSYGRERNRKNNIRREVREYLKELQND